jgi:hypothetical protein
MIGFESSVFSFPSFPSLPSVKFAVVLNLERAAGALNLELRAAANLEF